MAKRGKGKDVHRFGGNWTEQKLRVLGDYLGAYTTALKKAPFEKIYIDAFAGSGYRAVGAASPDSHEQSVLFPEREELGRRSLLDGSASIALQTDPPFDRYIFVEKNRDRCRDLEQLKGRFPGLADRVEITPGDANEEIRRLCATSWRSKRAALFLDPYGMQVEWATIEAIAGTKAIDLWLLFPLGIGVNRLLTRSGDVPQPWRKRLNLLLGTEAWEQALYQVESSPGLFGEDVERVEKATVQSIGKFFMDRLSQLFAGVAAPVTLRNSTNNPMYLLCFAVGNERGRDIALRIANHLMRGLH